MNVHIYPVSSSFRKAIAKATPIRHQNFFIYGKKQYVLVKYSAVIKTKRFSKKLFSEKNWALIVDIREIPFPIQRIGEIFLYLFSLNEIIVWQEENPQAYHLFHDPSDSRKDDASLNKWRKKLLHIDSLLHNHLLQRKKILQQIAAIKNKKGLPLQDEQYFQQKMEKLAFSQPTDKYIKNIFEVIHKESIAIQMEEIFKHLHP